jgi:hypothetical protein
VTRKPGEPFSGRRCGEAPAEPLVPKDYIKCFAVDRGCDGLSCVRMLKVDIRLSRSFALPGVERPMLIPRNQDV